MWPTLASVIILAVVWGRLERRVKKLAQGMFNPAVGWEKSNLYVRVGQGVVTLVLLVLIAASFFAFGWKTGLVALVLAFTVAGAAS